jgi:hypothetical protein
MRVSQNYAHKIFPDSGLLFKPVEFFGWTMLRKMEIGLTAYPLIYSNKSPLRATAAQGAFESGFLPIQMDRFQPDKKDRLSKIRPSR